MQVRIGEKEILEKTIEDLKESVIVLFSCSHDGGVFVRALWCACSHPTQLRELDWYHTFLSVSCSASEPLQLEVLL